MSEINEGVRILVERMKTNPEEFYEGYESKWAYIIDRAKNAGWLTEEEHKLLDDAVNELQRDRFTADVLKTLTREDPYVTTMENKKMFVNPTQAKMINQLMGSGGGAISTSLYTGNGIGSTVPSNLVTVGNSSITSNGSRVATQADIERILAQKMKEWEDKE